MAHSPRQESVGSKVCAVILTLCCLPCICIVGGLGLTAGGIVKIIDWDSPWRKRKKEKWEAKRQTPRVLEPRLERHLTIGREEPDLMDDRDIKIFVSSKQHAIPPTRTQEQMQSSLFKLPLEIRRQIYAETIGGYMIHTNYVHIYKHFNHTRCKISSETCDRNHCRVGEKPQGTEDAWGAIDLLALLKSCRRIYSEAIEILYIENTFDFQNLDFVLRFSLTVLPERFGLIRNFEWMTPENGYTVCCKTQPWLICILPQECCCISCLPEQVFTDLRSHKWVTYMWQMREVERNMSACQPVA